MEGREKGFQTDISVAGGRNSVWGDPGRVAEVRSKAEAVSRLREALEAGPELGCVPRVAGSPGRCWSGMVPAASLSRVVALAPECWEEGGGV